MRNLGFWWPHLPCLGNFYAPTTLPTRMDYAIYPERNNCYTRILLFNEELVYYQTATISVQLVVNALPCTLYVNLRSVVQDFGQRSATVKLNNAVVGGPAATAQFVPLGANSVNTLEFSISASSAIINIARATIEVQVVLS